MQEKNLNAFKSDYERELTKRLARARCLVFKTPRALL